MAETVVIDFQSHIEGITKANDALKKLGETDAKNAAQFQASNKRYQEETKKTIGANENLIGSLKNVAAAIGIAFGVHQIIEFGKEALALALKAEEVKTAFNRLGSVNLSELRKAVNGTLSDLKLMELTIKSANLKIPFEDLTKILEFAEVKAGALGRATDEVATSIIDGIGKGSSKTLKEFGLAVTELATDFDSTGKTSADAIRSIKQQLDGMPPQVTSNADKVEQLASQWENFKQSAGEAISAVIGGLFELKEALFPITNELAGIAQFKNIAQREVDIQKKKLKDISDAELASNITRIQNALKLAQQNSKISQEELLLFVGRGEIKNQQTKDELQNLAELSGQLKALKEIEDDRNKTAIDSFEIFTKNFQITHASIEELNKLADAGDKAAKEELERRKKLAEANKQFLEKQKKDLEFFNEQVEDLDKQTQEDRIQSAKDFRDNLVNLTQEELDTLLEEGQIPLDIYQETLDKQYELNKDFYEKQLEQTRKFNEEKKRIDAEYLEAKENIITAENQALIQGAEIAQNIFGESSGFAKAFLIFQKAVGIGQIVQDLQREKAANFLVAAEKSVLVPVLSETYYAIAAAKNQAANIRAGIGIATIASQAIPAFKLEKGGKLQGRSHAEGGIPLYEAEGGEWVVNKKASSKFDYALNAINSEKVAPELMNDFVRMASKDGKSGYMIKNEFDVFTLGKMYGKESNKVLGGLKEISRKMDGTNASKLLKRREKW